MKVDVFVGDTWVMTTNFSFLSRMCYFHDSADDRILTELRQTGESTAHFNYRRHEVFGDSIRIRVAA